MMKAISIVVASMLLATGFAVGATSPSSFCSAKCIAEQVVFYNQTKSTYCGVTGVASGGRSNLRFEMAN